MMVIGQEKPSLESLEHIGVMGMKWGHRKSQPTASDRIKQIDKKLNRFSGDKIVAGSQLKGWAINKGSKNPSLRAARSVAHRGAIEVGVILAGGALLLSKAQMSDKTRNGAQIAIALLAAQAAYIRVNDLRAISQEKRHSKLIDERHALVKEIKRGKK